MVIQTRFILLEGPLLFFGLFGILCVLRVRRYYSRPFSLPWCVYMTLGAASLTAAAWLVIFDAYIYIYNVCMRRNS